MIIQTFAPEYYICFFNMDTTKTTAVLFDFDGVVMDTETQYSVFWHKAGVDYLGMDDLESRIKGQTMTYIYDTFFAGKTKEQQEITAALNAFERDMAYDYIPGVLDFIADLRRNHVKMAVVTSSNENGCRLPCPPRGKDNVRPDSYRRDVFPFKAGSRLLPARYGSIRHNSRHHLCIRGLL